MTVRVRITTRVDTGGRYAWVETRYPGGRRLNTRRAIAAVRALGADPVTIRLAEYWHVPLRHHAFKIYYEVAGGVLDFASMTWTCMVCGDERPDAQIGVAHRPIPGHIFRTGQPPSFPDARVNVRYCLDRPVCVAEATADGPWWWR
jgi:hypothetical protein